MSIHDNALVAPATLSNRYINDQFLLDKSIDLVDEASSTILVEMNSLLTELLEENNQLRAQWEVEKKEVGNISEKRMVKFLKLNKN